MTDTNASPARPVSLFTIVFLFVLFAAFFFAVRWFYEPVTGGAQNNAADNLPKELEWRATADARRGTLKELREETAKQATSYAWVDQGAGVVRLPIERAMELTAQQYGKKN